MILFHSEVLVSILPRIHHRPRAPFRLPWWSSRWAWKSQRWRCRRFLKRTKMSRLNFSTIHSMPIFIRRVEIRFDTIPLQTCKSAEWDSSHDGSRFFWIRPRDFTHTGQHDSWIYVIGTDTVLAQFDGHRPSDLIHGSFRCTICRMIGYSSLESWKQLMKRKLHQSPVILLRPPDLTTSGATSG